MVAGVNDFATRGALAVIASISATVQVPEAHPAPVLDTPVGTEIEAVLVTWVCADASWGTHKASKNPSTKYSELKRLDRSMRGIVRCWNNFAIEGMRSPDQYGCMQPMHHRTACHLHIVIAFTFLEFKYYFVCCKFRSCLRYALLSCRPYCPVATSARFTSTRTELLAGNTVMVSPAPTKLAPASAPQNTAPAQLHGSGFQAGPFAKTGHNLGFGNCLVTSGCGRKVACCKQRRNVGWRCKTTPVFTKRCTHGQRLATRPFVKPGFYFRSYPHELTRDARAAIRHPHLR
jgi:hypothetical protein